MADEIYNYYVVYTYEVGGRGCYHAKLAEPLESYERILDLALQIAEERLHMGLVITNWKRIQ